MKISVCIPTYNGEKYIKEQLASILCQLAFDDEIIISDDSSTDYTIEIIKSFDDQRIKLYLNNKFKNPVFNAENAINKAVGEIIFLADQDDIWKRDKVIILKEHLKTHTLAYSNASIFFNNIIEESKPFLMKEDKQNLIQAIFNNNCIGATIAFRKELLKKALPFPNKIPMHDSWLFSIAEIYGSTFYENKCLIYYRRHNNNASFSGEKSGNTLRLKIIMRLNLLTSLIKRAMK
jgi:glycosyltransferase involved in cell wall biosynthesis